MRHFLRDHLQRMLGDERGNVFILFGAAAIPLLLIMGGAVDFARYTRYKTDLSNAVDSAALALARQHPDYSAAEAKTFVTAYVGAMNVGDTQFSVQTFGAVKNVNGFTVTASGTMNTIFLPLGKLAKNGSGINSMDVNIAAQVVNESNRIELALVIDNTGSMNCGSTVMSSCTGDWASPASTSRIVAIKSAAKSLVDILMPDDLDDKNLVKIALVPFEGQVNVASSGFDTLSPPNWIEWSDAGSATWDGANFNKRDTSSGNACTSGSTCKPVGAKLLFTKLHTNDANVKWAGCVEMRAGSYELSDAAPNTSVPDSLFVPFFWPDEPDSANNNGYSFPNNYLNDQGTFTTGSGWGTHEDPIGAQESFTKYTSTISWQSGQKDVEGLLSPYESGPNMGCPRPIYPLANANNKAAIKTQIDSMIAYPATGTFIPSGLEWGWHVVSPGAPYTEGIAPGDSNYSHTVKAIVLFTDGENDIGDDGNPNESRYNAYNYVATTDASGNHRLGSTNSAATTAINNKTATLCTNVKTNNTSSDTSDDIRVYVITFGTISSTATTLMTNCATVDHGSPLYYHAPTTSDLNDIFAAIGKDLADIHLSM